MTAEYEALQHNRTWSLVPYTEDMTLVGNKWGFKVKLNSNGSVQRYKVRLVAKEIHQTPGNDNSLIQQIITNLDSTFGLKILGPINYFLGISVVQTSYGMLLNQSKYAQEILLKYGMTNCNPCSTPMILGSKLSLDDSHLFEHPSIYRSLIGALQYLTMTRPDLSFALEGYADIDWASSSYDRKSTSGYCIFLGSNLIQWCSKKQQVVALSFTKAEYRALAHASTEIAWLQNLFQELHVSIPGLPVPWCDNTCAGALASNPVFHAHTKHIKIDVHFVWEMVQTKRLVVQYVASTFQVANILPNLSPALAFTLFAINFISLSLRS
ncbi:uncharacterized protein LOC116105405 [Pistacia vera]|uniref:uncharacterized protein LOC116105405 n=1 Tax=Pistacia vera TaxID=55513 RepID=UPI001263001E|nr:uncharacterized protein LOC116105405 [Pistacia vera]